MDAKPFAAPPAGLLARKGEARPAMRRPQLTTSVHPVLPVSVQEDLGWNDMGHDRAGLGADATGAAMPGAGAETPAPPPLTMMAAQRDDGVRLAAASAPAPDAPRPRNRKAARPLEASRASQAQAQTSQSQAPRAPVSGDDRGAPASSSSSAAAMPSDPAPAPRLPHRRARGGAPIDAAALARALLPRSRPAAFTLRLDPDRHLRLRLACALIGRSAQSLVTEALDHFLDGRPEFAVSTYSGLSGIAREDEPESPHETRTTSGVGPQ